jgi:glycosyltransferase involved in cell wall biosynthesis
MFAAIDILHEIGLPYVVTLTDFFPLCYRINLMRISGEICDGPHGGRACLTHCPVASDLPARLVRFYRLLSGAQARMVCSDFVRRQYMRAFPNLAFEVLPHGVDGLRAYAPVPDGERNCTGLRFGFLGTISTAKGVEKLLGAFALAELPNASLEIVGPTHDDVETIGRIKALAAQPGVTLKGGVASNEVFSVLSRFHVLCLPSQVPETFSLVLHQAFACGIPALVSDIGAPADTVSKHGCGWVVPHADITGWSQALRRIAHEPAILAQAKSRVPLPLRLEEEGFLYEHIYRRAVDAIDGP